MTTRQRSAARHILVAVVAVPAFAGTPRLAHAEDDVDGETPPSSSAQTAATGAFLPSALSASSEGRRGLVSLSGGYDNARRGGIYDTTAEAQITGPVSLIAGASYDGPGTDAAPHFELRVDALKQRKHGVDLAFSGGYSDVGFNTVPAVVTKLAIGRSVGPTYLLANLGYQRGLEEGEHAGELRVAALYPVTAAVHVGLDSRFQIDLERDDDEPSGETDWESRTGVVAGYTWNRLLFSAAAGVTSLRLRDGTPTQTGPTITGGLGVVF